MRRALLAIACVLLVASAARAQVRVDDKGQAILVSHVIVDSCSGCGGSAGPIAIDQTTPGTTNGVYVNNVPHIVCDSGCGSPPATADTSAFTFGSTSVSPIGAVVDDVATNTVSENSFGAPRMSVNRLLYVDLGKTTANATALKVDGSGVTQPVSGTFWQATQPVSGTFWQATQPVSLASMPSTPVTGTFWQATQPVSIASMPSTPVTGTFWQATQPVSIADGSDTTLGAKADAKSTATDTTVVSAMAVLKEISAMEQAPASRAVTNAGTFPVQAAQSGTWSGLRIVGNAGTSLDGTTAGIVDVYQRPSTSASVALSSSVKLTVTASVNIKASAGNVYGVSANNGAAAVCWVQFINSATAGTLGTGVVFSVVMPTSGTVTIPPGALALGNFSSGIAVGIASATNSSTACGTAGNVTVFFQ